MKGPGNDVVEVSRRWMKLFASHPGSSLSHSWSSASHSARAQRRCQIHGPATPEMDFFTCTPPRYWSGDTQGNHLGANPHDLDPPLLLHLWRSSLCNLGPAGMENHQPLHLVLLDLTLLAPTRQSSVSSDLISFPLISFPITYLSFPSESHQLWLSTSSVPGPGWTLRTQGESLVSALSPQGAQSPTQKADTSHH